MKKPLLVVVYRKRKNGKLYLETYNDMHVDELINSRKRKPLLPIKYEIEAIGVGETFVERFKTKYDIK